MWSDEPVHIIVVGCGRVGSELALELSEEATRSWFDKNRDNLRVSPTSTADHRGLGLRPRRLFQAEADDRRRPRGRDQRRQHQHSLRAHRARPLQHQERGGAHLRPGARRHLHEARHSHRRHVLVDDPQVKRWMLPADDSIEWTDMANSMHLVERIVPDALAGQARHQLSMSATPCAWSAHSRRPWDGSTLRVSSPKKTTSWSSSSPTTDSRRCPICSRGNSEGRHRGWRVGRHVDRP